MAIEKLYALIGVKGLNINTPYLFVSSDDGVTWNNDTFPTVSTFAEISDYRVKPDNQNMVLFANQYVDGDTKFLGLSYSIDACVTVTQCAGSFDDVNYNNVIWNWIHICPADPNIVWAISTGNGNPGYSGTMIAKSTDGGISFNYVNDANNIDGFGNTLWACIFSPNGTTVIIAVENDIYVSTDNGINFNYIGSAPNSPSYSIPNVYIDVTGTIVYAATQEAVFKYDFGTSLFTNVYTYSSPLTNARLIALEYINPTTFYFADDTGLFQTSDGFNTINPRLGFNDGANNTYLRPSFYNYSTGYYIDLERSDDSLRVYKTSDAGGSGTPKSILLATSGMVGATYDARSIRVATGETTGCGCPEGSVYNETTGLCDTTTNVCPPGSNWNPLTEQCEEPTLPCLLDLTIIIDQSGSINITEQAELKSLLYNIIDGIQDDGGTNRITSDNIRIGIAKFSDTGSNVLNLQGGAGAWAAGPGAGLIKASIAALPSSLLGRTATFDGLRSGYLNLTGINSRNGVANKRILLVTDGWANYTNGVSWNGINPGTPSSDSTCPNANPGNDPERCANTPGAAAWTANKRQNYYATMELADNIKTATGPDVSYESDITLVILGSTQDRLQTVNAYIAGVTVAVTDDVIFPTSTLLTDTTYFSVCAWDLAVNGNPSPVGNTDLSCKYYDAWYPQDGSGGVSLPSNNSNGDPDYFEASFDNGPAIASSIVDSLVCFNTVEASACNEPCVFNDQNGDCVCSTDTFNPCCYDLLDCTTGVPVYTVNTYALGYDPLAPYIGQVITIEGTDECLFLEVTENCTNTTPFPLDSALNIIPYENGCQECEQAQGSNPCYKLINCDNGNVLYTRLNLLSYVGQTVTLNEYPEMCWQVLQSNICPGPFVYITLGPDTYKDCECCAQYHCN
jgi:hypothetical protein